MRYIFIMLLALLGVLAQSQVVNQSLGAPNTIVTTKGNHYVDSVFRIPKRLISDARLRDTGSIYWSIFDSTINGWTGFQWLKFRAGGSFANNGLFKNGDTIKLGGTLTQETTINLGAFDFIINAPNINFTNHYFKADGSIALGVGSNTRVGINNFTPTVELDARGKTLLRNTTSTFEFTGWPSTYAASVNNPVLGVFGLEPSADILIDSNSVLQRGGITFRTRKFNTPKIPSATFGLDAGAKIEFNSYQNGAGARWVSALEFYLGDTTNTATHRFSISSAGNHFFGFRKVFTTESQYALFFGTGIHGSNFEFGNIDTTYLAGDADNRPLYILNMPSIAPDTTNYKPMVINNSNGKWYKSFWPTTGSGGGVTDFIFTDGSGFDGTVTTSTSTPTLSLTTTLTAGSIPIIGASGALTEDNANLFFDNTNNRLALGTTVPTHAVTLASTQAIDGIALYKTVDQVTNFGRGIIKIITSGAVPQLQYNIQAGGTVTVGGHAFQISGTNIWTLDVSNGILAANLFFDTDNTKDIGRNSSNAFRPRSIYAGTNFQVGLPANTAITAKVHIGAGTTAASTAPFKLTSGSLMTTAEAGAGEFLTDKLYFTITTGAARKEITLNDIALTAGRVPFVTTNGRLTDDANFRYVSNELINGSVSDAGVYSFQNTGGFYQSGAVKMDLGSDATGDIYYRDGSGNFVRLPISTNGKVLTITGGLPAWEDPTGGGGDTTEVVSPLYVVSGTKDTLKIRYDTTTITIRTTGFNDSALTVNTSNISTVQRLIDTAAAIRADFPAGVTSVVGDNGLTATGSTSVTVSLGGTLNVTTDILGAGNTLRLGTSGSKIGTLAAAASTQISLVSDARINLLGNIAYQAQLVSADANATVSANTGIVEVNTSNLTADRTLTLPTASTHGQVLTIVVRFASSGFHFDLTSGIENNASGSNITQLQWGTTYTLMVNATLAWMIVQID